VPTPLVTRFAPSPSGYLHLGHAYSALLNADLAQEGSGLFRLRIEDIDRSRCKPVYEAAILEDLEWLGIEAHGEVLRQSDRLPLYERTLQRLAGEGLLYRCFRTRAELNELLNAPHGPQSQHIALGPHPPEEEEAAMAEERAFAWRLDLRAARERIGETELLAEVHDGTSYRRTGFNLDQEIDPVLARKDVPTSYHLSCVIDDASQGVSLVCRGEDLRSSLPVQLLLQRLLGLQVPRYRHHRLILGEDGKRLAKRDRAATLRSLRESGVTKDEVRQRLGLPPR
jgi:glutamyl-Q tRNA(Asp) synthetase